jgi:hypothetical protein
MTELFANNATSTLAYGINDSDTSLTVAAAVTFPTTGNFRIVVENEIMLVTGVAGAVLSVSRGYESTTAVGHLAGVAVSQVLTAGSLDQFRTETKNPIVISPTVTADQDDYNPTGWGTAGLVRLTADNTRSITGFDAAVTYNTKTLINIGTNEIYLANDSASSSAGNRIYTPNGLTYLLPAGWSVELIYDSTSSHWRIVANSAGVQGYSFQYIASAGSYSTGLATWQRVGTVRVDPIQMGNNPSYTFRAWLDRNASTITVLCRLYNVTDGGEVSGSTLTFAPPDTDLGPKEFEAGVSLASTVKDYEVQLALGAQSGTDQGGISRADILVTFVSGYPPNPLRLIHTTTISYLVQQTDDLIEIGTLSTPINITLPAGPSIGETHEVKDGGGTLTTYNVTVLGNGHNVDGSSSFIMRVGYSTFKFIYDGTKWLVL